MSTLTLGTTYTTSPIQNTVQALGDVSGSLSVSVLAGAYISATATGAAAWTFTVSDPTAAEMACEWTVQITNGSTTQTFAALVDGYASTPVKWASGTAPSLTSSGTDILRFVKGAGNYVVGYRLATNVS
jgi:hypothetical protein